MLCVDIPAHMFVTCLALVLDPVSGEVSLRQRRPRRPVRADPARRGRTAARGMPLGLMPGMDYEEMRFQFEPGDCALLHSDGLAEAHAPDREMFGFPRVSALVGKGPSGEALIDLCLTELGSFTGPNHEQEDDITLVSLQRSPSAGIKGTRSFRGIREACNDTGSPARAGRLDAFTVPSQPGNERLALARVAGTVQGRGLSDARLERLKTAVAEATMNAIEHGNGNRAEIPVEVEVTQQWRLTSPSPSATRAARRTPATATMLRSRISSRSWTATRALAAGGCSSSATWSTRWT
jgi:hypothetical protein